MKANIVHWRTEMQIESRIYIDGAWIPASGSEVIEVVDASTEETLGRMTTSSTGDLDRAVAAARRAFTSWSTLPQSTRTQAIERISEAFVARAEDLALTISREVGMPIQWTRLIQVQSAIGNTDVQVKLLTELETDVRIGSTLVTKEPIGVVGAITPWNYPMHQVISKIIPAIGVGCTVVLKPSEVAPLSAFLIAAAIDDAGLPPGVFNLVTGRGPEIGEAMAAHPDIDMISFTGSTAAGRRVSELAAQTVKRVTLELGGKSANLFLDDADFERDVPPGIVRGCYMNSGQTCAALTRMIVPRGRQDEVIELALAVTNGLRVGPADTDVDLGPLVSATQRERVRNYIRAGVAEGARLVAGGPDAPDGLDVGYYVRPTVFADVTKEMTIAQQEIFGPVLCILPYDTVDEAVDIANSTMYGLAGAVHSADLDRALSVARRLRTGQVNVNNGEFNLLAPFGGYRQSGNGRELGAFGMDEFFETKTLLMPAST